ncbi:hypothetical protein AB1A81_02955 [Bdellovibrio bacteriovorus]|uniref:Transglycosylase SLT domain-containing protein n=1 Tax=Bdellovibrio bacteriovorus (strain ATCC 15356 / DSM 50701 / NCIMB 9529 / HD100) TaxID=264462 RepID=Q6MQ40_BDEBA|nr:hypothetical protein [Bdellovibrio bacteriovorus]CAE78607.1 hypothetical protein predicted by Glimmer/Critica [Bdellovibrio bacteriovorus HD100]
MKTQKSTTNILMALLVTTTVSSTTFAMAKKPVNSGGGSNAGTTPPATTPPTTTPPSTTPPTTTPPVREPAAVTDSITPEGFNVFSEVAYPVGGVVDTRYSNYRELLPVRNAQEAHATDKCDTNLDTNDRFADRIAYAVELKMQPSKAQLGYVASYFNLNKDVNTYLPNSLISHPLCNVTSSTLNTTFAGKNIPSAATIKKINDFTNLMNGYRREALSGNREGYVKASKLWSKFMMCLSYMESLTTADTAKAQRVADKYGPSGYRRPAGVNFYEDPNQPAESRLNIGLFQFTPDAGGNIQACIREWNQLYPKCGIKTNASQSELIRVLGSSLQTFNAFCAAAKVTGSFAVQVNATSSKNTHPYNVKSNGSLKAPAERCVSPHMSVGRSYNHFGPFQNTSGFTLDNIISCTMAGE